MEEIKIPRYAEIKDKVLNNYIANVNSRNLPEDIDSYYEVIEKIKESGMELETFLALVLKENLQLQEKENINFGDYDKKQSDRSTKRTRSDKAEKGMVRFHINVGKKSKVRVADIVGAVAGECDIQGKHIGSIDLFDNYSFFEIPSKYENTVLSKMKNVKIKGKKITAQLSK